jgi:hypothetical protein
MLDKISSLVRHYMLVNILSFVQQLDTPENLKFKPATKCDE